MDYGTFVALREPGWAEFERRLEEAQARPRAVAFEQLEYLAVRYRQVLHDSGLANARFPGTGAARRLNRLAVVATRLLHQQPRDSSTSFLTFWTDRFPRAFRRNRANTLGAVFLFLVGAAFGMGLSAVRPAIATHMLGPRALEGLRDGRLWTESIVQTVPPSISSSAIARNNLSVALVGWAGGALAGIGAVYVLFLNGFLLGAIFGVTLHYSLAHRLLEFVAAHGPLEITLILVTAAAGLRMGRALVEASDLPRSEALRAAARDALVILLGSLPWLIPLGLIEGFVSGSPAVPVGAKALIGASMLVLFLWTAWNPFLKVEEAQ